MKYIPITELVGHPRNVRAKTEYAQGSIAALAATIKSLGLLQSLVVQQLDDGTYGVLAGRRRMMALQMLTEAGDLEAGFKAPCKLIPKDTDHVTALSLAENTMQEPMDPLDEFEAFAAMTNEGNTVDDIAATFGATVRAVKERLRYGLIHEDIRAAARARTITLDAMKAYAAHPCLDTQKRVFDGFQAEGNGQPAYRIRAVLDEQDIRADDPLAVMVLPRYRERGGEVIAGLFEEDTVLKDRALAEAIRDEMLTEAGETHRVASGFKWFETRPRIDYSELSAYGRIYERQRELDEEGEARLGVIAERLDEIAGLMECEETPGLDYDALNDEHETLELEADELQNGYLPEQAAHAGFIVAPDGAGGFMFQQGLVRNEDCPALAALQAQPEVGEDADGSGSSGDDAEAPIPTGPRFVPPSGSVTVAGLGGGTKEKADPLSLDALSNALKDDLAVQRGAIIECELANNPDLARDALIFRMTMTLLTTGYFASAGIDVRVQRGHRTHSRPETLDAGVQSDIDKARETLDLSFLDAGMSGGDRFRAFRELEADMKERIMAVCVGATVEPQLARNASEETFMEAVASEAVEDIRMIWKPTVENYWSRVTRDHMLALLTAFGLDAEADEHRSVKKATLAAYMEKLFSRPFATLTEAQRIAVETWTPPGMGTQGDMLFEFGEEEVPSDHDAPAGEPDITYSNLEPDEKVVGVNADGETLIEDANGVRSVETGGVCITEPVPIVPGAGIIAPNPGDRKPRFMTADEAEALSEAA